MRYATAALGTAGYVIALATGCASNGVRQQPDSESLARAAAAVEQAELAGAQRYATRQLDVAREKLDRAHEAQQREDYERAADLAQEAALDAQLAAATAGNQEMQAAVEELRASLETLREELAGGRP